MRNLSILILASLLCIIGSSSFAENNLVNVPYEYSTININPQEIQIGSGIQYKLMPNDPQLIANQYLWTVSALCVIKSKADDNFLSIKVTKKQGTLNNEVLVAGDSRTIRLKYEDEMSITAKSGAEVELLNIGKNPIITECTFGF